MTRQASTTTRPNRLLLLAEFRKRRAIINLAVALCYFSLSGISQATEVVILDESFDTGMPNGWVTEGLWHHSTACSLPVGEAQPGWMYFGFDASCDFADGQTQAGILRSPLLCFPGDTIRVTMTYRSRYAGEAGVARTSGRDWAWAGSFRDVVDDVSGDGDDKDWVIREVDLTPIISGYDRVYWHFDSVDGQQNAEVGWLIDDVRITAELADDKLVENTVTGKTFGSLTAAIRAARAGDEIVLSPGVYLERLVLDKDVLVRGLNPDSEAIVRATRIDGPGDSVQMSSGTLQGVTITAQNTCSNLSGSAIVASGTALIDRCIVTDTWAPKTDAVRLSGDAVFQDGIVEAISNSNSTAFAVALQDQAELRSTLVRDNLLSIASVGIRDQGVAARNTVINNHGDGGPGGVVVRNQGVLTGNFVSRNRAGSGHVGVLGFDQAILLNNTITHNGTTLGTGGLLSQGECVIRGNVVAFNGGLGDLGIGGTANDVDFNCVFGNRCQGTTDCAPYGSGTIASGPHDIHSDPLLSDAGNGYQLAPESPCIDAGDPLLAVESGAIDLDGNPRVRFGRIDIGAAEGQQLPCDARCNVNSGDADVTGDCRVDLADLARVLANFGTATVGHAAGDVDFDGDVDEADLLGVLERFGQGCRS